VGDDGLFSIDYLCVSDFDDDGSSGGGADVFLLAVFGLHSAEAVDAGVVWLDYVGGPHLLRLSR